MRKVLTKEGLSDEQIKDIIALLDNLAFASYAPSSNGQDSAKKLSDELISLVNSLKSWV